jgi:hypothetical protein
VAVGCTASQSRSFVEKAEQDAEGQQNSPASSPRSDANIPATMRLRETHCTDGPTEFERGASLE